MSVPPVMAAVAILVTTLSAASLARVRLVWRKQPVEGAALVRLIVIRRSSIGWIPHQPFTSKASHLLCYSFMSETLTLMDHMRHQA